MHLNGLPLCPWVKTGEPFHLHYVNAFFDLFSLALELAPPLNITVGGWGVMDSLVEGIEVRNFFRAESPYPSNEGMFDASYRNRLILE